MPSDSKEDLIIDPQSQYMAGEFNWTSPQVTPQLLNTIQKLGHAFCVTDIHEAICANRIDLIQWARINIPYMFPQDAMSRAILNDKIYYGHKTLGYVNERLGHFEQTAESLEMLATYLFAPTGTTEAISLLDTHSLANFETFKSCLCKAVASNNKAGLEWLHEYGIDKYFGHLPASEIETALEIAHSKPLPFTIDEVARRAAYIRLYNKLNKCIKKRPLYSKLISRL